MAPDIVAPTDDAFAQLPFILVTGATGYIGGRLLRRFEEDGRRVRCFVRQTRRLADKTAPSTELIEGDCLDEASLDRAVAGVDTAYYLIHSMAASSDFVAIATGPNRSAGILRRHSGLSSHRNRCSRWESSAEST